MKILIVGSGGREHAIGYQLKKSPLAQQLYFAPGNAGTAQLGENLPIAVTETDKLLDFALKQQVDLTVVGPELPLSLGIADLFCAKGLKIFGPDHRGAMLETSKAYSKQFMETYGIPTGGYQIFSSVQKAKDFLLTAELPVVIKADGLAQGKGVVICKTRDEALQTAKDMMVDKAFGTSGDCIVIEEFLEGPEVSLLCFTDGKTIVPMESASDYKRAYDGDRGPNTGGMGSVSPSFYYQNGRCDDIAQKTLAGIKSEGFDFRGVIYIGLMMTADGPKVLEYNVRFGDPETEALLPRLESDLAQIMLHTVDGTLDQVEIQWSASCALTVVVASDGYPGAYRTGIPIELPSAPDGVLVFHAATKKQQDTLVLDGRRVLCVTAVGSTMQQARTACYEYLNHIQFPGSFYRKDIGCNGTSL